LSVIEDGSVLIRDGEIVEVGPTRRVENLRAARGADEIDAGGSVLMPGFIDCHAHLLSGSARRPLYAAGREAVAAASQGVREAPASRLRAEAELLLKQASRYGTTTLAALSGYGVSESVEVKILRVLGELPVAPVLAIPSYFAALLPASGDPADSIEPVCSSTIPRVATRRLSAFIHAACGPGSFSSADCLKVLDEGRQWNLKVRVDFAAHGREEPLQGLLAADVQSVDHLEYANDDDVAALANSAAAAVLVPATAFALGGRHAPARALADAGAMLAMGSDFNRATTPTLNMQFAIYLACRQMKLTAEEAITAATINGAYVLGLGDKMGSIEPGKRANLILLKARDYHSLAWEFGMNLISMTIQDGKVVCDRREAA